MTTELRVLQPDEWDAWFSCLATAFGGALGPEAADRWRGVAEIERSLLASEGDAIVGTAGTFSFRMTVPGGSPVPTGGLTMVSVAATHRRRGVLTSMMRRQLDDVRAAGEPLAVLTATEPAIYGRFGYGVATRKMAAALDTDRVVLDVPESADGVRLRSEDPVKALAACEALYAGLVPTRPGMLERRPGWAAVQVSDPPGEREGASALRCVLAERDGELVGYARYAVKPDWDEAGPRGVVRLHDLEAVDPGSRGALWRFLFGVDLTSTIEAGDRPLDDTWRFQVSDLRRCRIRVQDSLHLRPVDVGAALAARAYAGPVDTVLEVGDGFCPWNAGRWRLSGDDSGAVCTRTTDPAELELTVRELGAAYLGDASLGAMGAAGLVRELRPGALARVSRAFATDTAPWLPHGF